MGTEPRQQPAKTPAPDDEAQARIRAQAAVMLPAAVLTLIFWLIVFGWVVACIYGTWSRMP